MDRLIKESVYILREVKSQLKNPAVMWSTGKDSTAMLGLIRMAFYNDVPFPVIHIDTGFKFKEIYDFRDKVAKKWNLNLIISKNEDAIKEGVSSKTKSVFECCNALKTEALKQTITEYGFDSLIMSIRRDEHHMRNIERYFSPRDKEFKWHFVRPKTKDEVGTGDSPYVSEQNVELWDLYQTDFGSDCSHIRVHPILNWNEINVWEFIKKHNLPVNPLYFKGFRSLGCECCTKPTMTESESIEEIISKIVGTDIKERYGRERDKEDIIRRLRVLGYM